MRAFSSTVVVAQNAIARVRRETKNEGMNKIEYQMGLSRAPRYFKKKREKNERERKK